MAPQSWSNEEIRDLIAGKFVALTSVDNRNVPMPQWILDGSLGPVGGARGGSNDKVAEPTTHPDDRRQVFAAFQEAVKHPGTPFDETYRTNVRGSWVTTTLTMVNLIDDPAVGGILSCAKPGRPIDEPDVALVNEGEHNEQPWILGRTNVTSTILEIEGKVLELTGRTAEEVIGLTPVDLMHPDSCGDSVAMWWTLIAAGGNTATSRRCFLHPDGTEVWAECTYLNRLGESGKHDILWMANDITERRAQEQALIESHEEIRRLADESHALAEDFRLLADEVPAAVFRCDPDGTITFHNIHWSELLPGTALVKVQDAVHPSDRPRLDEAFAQLVSVEGADRTRLEMPSASGGRVFAVTCRSDGDEVPSRRRIVGSIEDVTIHVRLRREANHDKLTGLLNRQGLDNRLVAALAEDPSGTLLVFFDLDGFKTVNDVHGHDAGDVVLRELGARLAGAVRPSDTVSRYGGDEFVLVCSAVEDDGSAAIVNRLLAVLAAPILFEGGSWAPSASIGTARGEAGDDPATLITRADLAMFEAKRAHYETRRTSRHPA
jgi:diguanylate cyclase (GGDEF)-like protein/PAS domain S-box-containing protein